MVLCGAATFHNYNCDDFDIVHVHGGVEPEFFELGSKFIYDIHAYNLVCPVGNYCCQILNRFLDKPLTCLNCLGNVGIRTGMANMEKYFTLARKADMVAVHSKYMCEFYHTWNPTMLPVPMETDELLPCDDKKDYLFYTGRMSYEKNPYGFVEIVKRSGMKGVMCLYDLSVDETKTRQHYEDLLNCKDVEIVLNPTKQEMISLVQHAKMTVLPYFFAEPLGIAAINSILCGTPVVAFGYGNYRNLTCLLPKNLNDMVSMVQMDDSRYRDAICAVKTMGDKLRIEHDPKRAVEVWDSVYDTLK